MAIKLIKFSDNQKFAVEWLHLNGSPRKGWDRDSDIFNSREEAKEYIKKQREKYQITSEDVKARIVKVG